MIKSISNISFFQENKFKKDKYNNQPSVTSPAFSKKINSSDLLVSLQQYDVAKNYYNSNLNNDKPVIPDLNLLNQVLLDSKASKNLYMFFAERARNEIAQLKSKKNLTPQEKEMLEGYENISKAFSTPDSFVKSNYLVSFGASQSNKNLPAKKNNKITCKKHIVSNSKTK